MADLPRPPTMDGTYTWGTGAECAFVDGLGTWNAYHHLDRLTLLRRYQRTCWRRATWGTIDQARVLAHVGRAIATEEQTHAHPAP